MGPYPILIIALIMYSVAQIHHFTALFIHFMALIIHFTALITLQRYLFIQFLRGAGQSFPFHYHGICRLQIFAPDHVPYMSGRLNVWRGLRLYAGGSGRGPGSANGAGATFHSSSNIAMAPSTPGTVRSTASSAWLGLAGLPGTASGVMGVEAPLLPLVVASPTEIRSGKLLLC